MTFFLSGSVKRPTAFVFTFHWRGDGSLQDASETGFSEAQIADSVCVKTVALRKAPEEQPLLQVSSLLKKSSFLKRTEDTDISQSLPD